MPASEHLRLHALREGDVYRISQDGREIGVDYDPGEARTRLYRACYSRATEMLPAGTVFLHAASVGFRHPASGAKMVIEAPLPAELQTFLDALE